MPNDLSKEDAKAAMKEAIKEWMDEQFTTFGKWSLGAFAAGALGAIVYFILNMNGWHK